MTALPDEFPARAEAMAKRAGLAFFNEPEIIGRDPVMRFPRPLGEAAATAIGLCGDAAAEIWRRHTGVAQCPRVVVRHASAALAGFAYQLLTPGNTAIRARDWEAEPEGLRAWGVRSMLRGENAGNPAVGLYLTRDERWFHVHGGLPHLADRIMDVLGTDGPMIGATVAKWEAAALEEALAEAGTCGVAVRDEREWLSHPQGKALAGRPVVEVIRIGDGPHRALPGGGDRPLEGLRALDLSLALAGPTCARTLAEHGAHVLKISAPDRADRQPFELETGHGKRAASLDLDRAVDRNRLSELARSADVFAQGYRPGALARRGFGPDELAALAPGVVYVSINCYGHAGPWVGRRGWEGTRAGRDRPHGSARKWRAAPTRARLCLRLSYRVSRSAGRHGSPAASLRRGRYVACPSLALSDRNVACRLGAHRREQCGHGAGHA